MERTERILNLNRKYMLQLVSSTGFFPVIFLSVLCGITIKDLIKDAIDALLSHEATGEDL